MENSQDEIQARLKNDILLEVALEEADEKDRDETGWAETLAIFIESGKSEIEHQIWREKKLGPLLMGWLQLVDSGLNQSPRSLGTVALVNEWGEDEQYEHLEFSPIRASRTQIEVDIAKWYLRNLEINNFAYPGCANDSMQELLGPEVAYLYWQNKNKQPFLAAQIGDKTNTLEGSKGAKPGPVQIKSINKKTEQKRYMKLRPDELEEKQALTRKDVVKHAYPDLRNSSNVINQNVEVRIEQLGRALSDQASRAKRDYKELNDGELELPIRLYTKRGGAWDQYALTHAGKRGEGNKYGIIKASLSTDQS